MKVIRSLLRPMDRLFTTDVSYFSFIEKWKINGLWSAISDIPPKLPTHVATVIEDNGELMLREMMIDKNTKNRIRLTTSDIERYEDNNFIQDRIVRVIRISLYDDPLKRQAANDRLIRTKLNYDILEIGRFFGLPVKNDPNKLVCSSQSEQSLNQDGYTFTDFPLDKNPQGLSAPYEQYNAKFVKSKDGNRYPVTIIDCIR